MKQLYERRIRVKRLCNYRAWLVSVAFLLGPLAARAQTWSWTYETVDASTKMTALKVDHEGNVHISYAGDGGSSLKYAFREANSHRWFTMVLDKQLQDFATSLGLDPQGNPHICYTPRDLKYAHFDGHKWVIEPIAPGEGSVEYNCTILVGPDNTPHVLWYQTRLSDGTNYLHLKYADLEHGVWVARTVDFDREDGKWNSMVLDAQGTPHLIYSVFPPGELKSAYWDGKNWKIQSAISPSMRLSTGMGNSLVLDSQQELEFSVYESPLDRGSPGQGILKFVHQKGATWSVETVDSALQGASWVGYRSTLVLDKSGFPHISYEDGGALKHAYSDGSHWHIQVVAPRGSEAYLYSSMAIGQDDTLYIAYRHPMDGSLMLAIGHPTPGPSTTTTTSIQQEK